MTEKKTPSRVDNLRPAITALLLAVMFIIILRRAWISDDAYITFRTVDNFINGYGLTWNTGERVQAYTHPLWMFLISFLYFFTHEIYFTTIILSLVLSFVAVVLIPARLSGSFTGSALAVLTLTFSNAFVDYSTSGLENPLSYLLAGLFLLKFFECKGRHTDLLLLSLIASLAALNRLDSMVIYLPALVVAFLKTKDRLTALVYAGLGQLPMVIWELFSIVYYGFPFPNTYYAKLGHMIPGSELLVQGLRYCQESLMNDPLTLVAILIGAVVAVWTAASGRGVKKLLAAVGVLIYIAAILRTGGDFMSGRFFALPLYIMVALLSRMNFNRLRPAWQAGVIALPVMLGLMAAPPTYEVVINDTTPWYGIVNERSAYFEGNGMINQSSTKSVPHHAWVEAGSQLQQSAEESSAKTVAVESVVGMIGFFAGADVHIIDTYALGDALIARLPAMHNPNWRIGHHRRVVPDGYEESIRTGKNLLADKQLAEYYDRLKLIISGDLFSQERLKVILAMNRGRYQALIDFPRYLYPYKFQIIASELPQVQAGEKPASNLNPNGGQVMIFLELVSHASDVEIGLIADEECHAWFANNKNILYKTTTDPGNGEGMQSRLIHVPQTAAKEGYDFIWLVPDESGASCVPGWITLLE